MSFSIATWNINSVRLRLPLVEVFLERYRPDVLCLQETKCPNDAFPFKRLRRLGYEHILAHGQKGYHGVATLSRRPILAEERMDYGDVGHARHVSAIVEAGGRRIRLHNFYVPAGGDEPDPAINPKFAHKLNFLDELKRLHSERERADGVSSVLVGDLNVAPLETDVWSHKQLLRVVSHTPVETEGLKQVQAEGAWVDLIRRHIPPEEKVYTWWSYRARDWAASDRGRRLDHIWSSADLAADLLRVEVLREARGWERPSDHVPVIAHFDLGTTAAEPQHPALPRVVPQQPGDAIMADEGDKQKAAGGSPAELSDSGQAAGKGERRTGPAKRSDAAKEAALDEGLEETFPASDPVAVTQSTRTGGPSDFSK